MQPLILKSTHNLDAMAALKDHKSFTKAIRTAKRIASGKRAAEACVACKKSRARCNDTRPCKRCLSMGDHAECDIPNINTAEASGTFLKRLFKATSQSWPMETTSCKSSGSSEHLILSGGTQHGDQSNASHEAAINMDEPAINFPELYSIGYHPFREVNAAQTPPESLQFRGGFNLRLQMPPWPQSSFDHFLPTPPTSINISSILAAAASFAGHPQQAQYLQLAAKHAALQEQQRLLFLLQRQDGNSQHLSQTLSQLLHNTPPSMPQQPPAPARTFLAALH
jgi:hypothetical protein